jgi:hypothetical protein
MRTTENILEQWFGRSLESYPGATLQFIASEKDQFRNPVGFALRENLATLVQEVLGDMDSSKTNSALQEIVRVRAVQNLTAIQAVEFIFFLRAIVHEQIPEFDRVLLDTRIDMLALMTFDEYVRCREHLSEIRLNESRRAMAVPAALQRARG